MQCLAAVSRYRNSAHGSLGSGTGRTDTQEETTKTTVFSWGPCKKPLRPEAARVATPSQLPASTLSEISCQDLHSCLHAWRQLLTLWYLFDGG